MILELDAGNTRVKWRVLDAEGRRRGGGFLASDATAGDMLEPMLAARGLTSARMVSVASPVVAHSIAHMLERSYGINLDLILVGSECLGVMNPYEIPRKLGADRWLAVLAAKACYGENCLVVDCGSAVTVELLAAGKYLGGVISPGAGLMFKSLYSDTHQVKVSAERPVSLAPGLSTEAAVRSGVWGALVGLVSQYRELLLADAGQIDVVVCGGDAKELAALLPFDHHIHEELVLDGLAVAQSSASNNINEHE